MRIHKEQTAGLIIDIQERLFPHIHKHEKIARNTRILIEGLKALEIPVLVTQQYTKGLGETIPEIAEALSGQSHIEKISFSCCDEPAFMKELVQQDKEFVIIAGIEAHVCVLQTALDLVENSYIPVVVHDCVSSRKKNDFRMAIERMRNEGIVITTCESVLFELCRFAGTDSFKQISRLVK
ncbi:MAG: hydrolase [Bacteroidales bacterium]|nr:hydrolase [Bacteroidales bacterium]